MSTKQYVLTIFTVVLTVLGSFYSGYFLKELITKNDDKNIPQKTKREVIPYFNDEIVLITKDKPHYTLIANASRFSNENDSYTNRQKIFFFDGIQWTSKFSTVDSDSLSITTTPTIPKWEVIDDPSRVLKQSVKGNVQTDNSFIEFNVPLITNELGIRSLAGYTVFRSEANGELTIDGKKYVSYVLYTRTYSYNASIGLIALSKDPIGIGTDWIAFWDAEGNFYNIDETIVDDKEVGPYKSHSIAVLKDNEGRVKKSFTLNIQKNNDIGYDVNILEGINKTINTKFLNAVSRNPTNQFVDNKIGQLEGMIKLENGKVIKGFGIYEYIRQ